MKKIKISGLNGEGHFALVDDEDYKEMKKHSWYLTAGGHVITFINKRMRSMHRLVMKANDGVIDHKNGNPLDNRKKNLRPCTHAENNRNARPPAIYKDSKYKGVRRSSGNTWQATLNSLGSVYTVRGFSTDRDAAIMYNYLAKQHFGEFAWLNDVRIKLKKNKRTSEKLNLLDKKYCNKDGNP